MLHSFNWIIVLLASLSRPLPTACQGLTAKSNVPLRNLVVLANGTAELSCDTVPPDRHDEVILVLWFRENVGTPIFSADAREVALSQAGVWFDEDILKRRASFRGRLSEPSILSIANISLADQSVYRCRVDFREAKSRNARVNLTVIEPPRSLVVTAETGQQRVPNLVGPFRVGDRPKFTCIVEGGLPVPTITWRRNRVTVTGQIDTDEPGLVRSTLFLSPLKRSDWPMTLSCSASNWDRGRPLEHSFDIDMELPPVSVSVMVGDRNPTVGQAFSLPCHVVGSRPTPKITWWMDDVLLDSTTYNQTLTTNGSLTVSVLDLKLNKSAIGSRVTCRAINPQLDATAMDDTWIVDLNYAPNVSLAMGRSLNAEGIKAGDDVYFDCHVDARPPPSRIDWRRNGVRLLHNTSANVIVTNQSLVLQNVGRSMAGNISCGASNLEGHSSSQQVFLDIKYPPICKPGLTRYFGVSRAENVEIGCQVEANPSTDLSYKWYLNNTAETIEVPRARYNNSPSASILGYRPTSMLDYGTLFCYATNSAGVQKEPCVFHILTAGPPEPVFNCTTSNHSSDAFLIACQPGFHGGLPQNFSLHFFEDGGGLGNSSSGSTTSAGSSTGSLENSFASGKLILHRVFAEPVFLLTSLKINKRFKALIASFNAKGKSEEVVVEISTIKEPERQLEVKPGKSTTADPRSSGFTLTPTLVILSCVVVLLFIGGVIGVVFLRRQCHREAAAVASRDGNPGRTDPSPGQHQTHHATSTLSKAIRHGGNSNGLAGGGANPRSQSLKPLIGSVDCDINGDGGSTYAPRTESERWKEQIFNHPRPVHLTSSQLGWPVGEPPPPPPSMTPPPPPPPVSGLSMIEAGLITPPYATDSSLDLRSPDIIPPPIIGSCDFGPATLPRSYKGFGIDSSTAQTREPAAKKPHVTWSDTMPKAFRQSHEFLRRETSSSNGSILSKRESVV